VVVGDWDLRGGEEARLGVLVSCTRYGEDVS
jgi:hypothetical protein